MSNFLSVSGVSAVPLVQSVTVLNLVNIPFIWAPSGTATANGVVFASASLQSAYPNAWVYHPSGAITPTQLPGFYLSQFTTASQYTAFNNMYASGPPTIPSPLVAFSATAQGAFSATTGSVSGPQFSIPANALAANDQMRIWPEHTLATSANNKGMSVTYGGQNIYSNAAYSNAQASARLYLKFVNRQSQSANFAWANSNGSIGTSNSTSLYSAVNTANAQALVFNGTTATGTDWMVLENVTIEILKG